MSLALCLLITPFVLWAVARLAGLDRAFPWIQLMAFTPYIAILSIVPVVAALVTRHWWIAALAALAAVALLTCVLPRWFADPAGVRVPHEGPAVRFLTSNMLEGGADAAALVALVREHRVDVLALQEFTPVSELALAEAGLGTCCRTRSWSRTRGSPGSALFSRYPLTDDGERVNPGGFVQARADRHGARRARRRGGVGHTRSRPARRRLARPGGPTWPASRRPPADGTVRVLLGDFNATLDHWALRRLLATGYRDAADVDGRRA